jgi:hypothetical protein
MLWVWTSAHTVSRTSTSCRRHGYPIFCVGMVRSQGWRSQSRDDDTGTGSLDQNVGLFLLLVLFGRPVLFHVVLLVVPRCEHSARRSRDLCDSTAWH